MELTGIKDIDNIIWGYVEGMYKWDLKQKHNKYIINEFKKIRYTIYNNGMSYLEYNDIIKKIYFRFDYFIATINSNNKSFPYLWKNKKVKNNKMNKFITSMDYNYFSFQKDINSFYKEKYNLCDDSTFLKTTKSKNSFKKKSFMFS